MNPEYTIILFYKYVHIEEPEKLKKEQQELATSLGLTGRVIIAHEGINATYEGTTENIEKYLKTFLIDTRFADTHIKKSAGTGEAFPKLSIKVRQEIVSLHLGDEDFSPTEVTGKRLKPEELKQWFETKKVGKDFFIVDMRNDYEHAVGHFEGSVLPRLKNFRDLPNELLGLEHLKGKVVVPVCTGGVRCEKASGYLIKKGFEHVYQLDGGIVSYMEKYPVQEFKGTLYVFDRRITMDFDPRESHVVVGKCALCGTASERYVNCRNRECNKHYIACTDCVRDTRYCSENCASVLQNTV